MARRQSTNKHAVYYRRLITPVAITFAIFDSATVATAARFQFVDFTLNDSVGVLNQRLRRFPVALFPIAGTAQQLADQTLCHSE